MMMNQEKMKKMIEKMRKKQKNLIVMKILKNFKESLEFQKI